LKTRSYTGRAFSFSVRQMAGGETASRCQAHPCESRQLRRPLELAQFVIKKVRFATFYH
jgi:hypothetical protein